MDLSSSDSMRAGRAVTSPLTPQGMSEQDVQSTHQAHYDRCQKAVELILDEIDEASWVLFANVRDLHDVMQDLERVRGMLAKS